MGTPAAVAALAAIAATVVFLGTWHRQARAAGRRGRGSGLLHRSLTPMLTLLPAAACLLPWVSTRTLAASVALTWVTTLPWLTLTRRWGALAHTGWSLTVSAGALYLIAMARWTVTSGMPWTGQLGSWLVWVLEVLAWVLLLVYGWEIYEVLGSRHWSHRLPPALAELEPGEPAPLVSIHVPCHNEPPDLVIETLTALMDLDYPAYEVLVVDNNTTDDTLWPPVEQFCREHPHVLRFHRLVDWPGYKSGALNYAEEHTHPAAEVVGVVDADYQVRPDWLRRTVGAFRDPDVAFVQTPQDYRDWHHSAYLRRLYASYDFFFAVSQPSRDERGGAIFGGTMGLVRRSALRAVGGWDEWCVTEDAELSLRLLEHGWTGHHLDESFGHGLMPLTFEALKGQRFRWCFGGMQLLRMHWRALMPWDRSTRLTQAQRLAYLSGGFQWFGDLLSLAFALVVMASLLDLAFGDGLILRRLSGLLLVAVPALILSGLSRAVATVKIVHDRLTWRDAVGVFLIWLSLGWVVSVACVRGLVEPQGVFLRTPKVREDVRWIDGLRANRAELVLSAAAVGSVVSAVAVLRTPVVVLLASLLLVPVAGWLAAPAHSVAAWRSDLPDMLRRRRSAERSRTLRTGTAAVSLASLAAASVGVAFLATALQPGSTQQPRTSIGPLPTLSRPSPSGPAATSSATTSSTTSSPSTPVRARSSSSASSTTTSTTAPTPSTTTPPATTSSATTTQPPGSTVTSTAGSPTTTVSTSRGSPTSHPTGTGKPTTTGP